MKIINFLVLPLLLVMLILSGCAQQEEANDLSKAYIGGNKGIEAYLLDGMPPAAIHDNGNFPFGVGVVLENQGETDIGVDTDNPFVRVRLEGINPSQFGVSPNDVNKALGATLRGARKNFDGSMFPGEITTVTFEPLVYSPDVRGNSQFTIRADVCYDYETFATAQICLKDDVLENIADDSICSLSGEKFPQNSGAPLQITSVVQNPMASNKIQVNFVIEHVGTGEFFGRTPANDPNQEICDFSPRNFNKYFVDVEIEPLDDPGMAVNCGRFNNGRQGRIKLYQGAPTTVSCTITRTTPSTGRVYQDLLNIILRYRYGQYIETPIIIQDVSN